MNRRWAKKGMKKKRNVRIKEPAGSKVGVRS